MWQLFRRPAARHGRHCGFGLVGRPSQCNGKLEVGAAPGRRWAVVVALDRGEGSGIAVPARTRAVGNYVVSPLQGSGGSKEQYNWPERTDACRSSKSGETKLQLRTRFGPGPRSLSGRCGVAYEALLGCAPCGGLKVQTLGFRGREVR